MHKYEERVHTLDSDHAPGAHAVLVLGAKELHVVHYEGTHSNSLELLESVPHRSSPTEIKC